MNVDKKYCVQCLECNGVESEIDDEKNKHCLKCIEKYKMCQCNECGEYKSSTICNVDRNICDKCKWHVFKCCGNCKKDKQIGLFLDDDKYCGDCQSSMEIKCLKCGEKTNYYKLDNGKYCVNCQKSMLLKCKGCKNISTYSNFYYSRTRIWCKQCVVNRICIPFDRLLVEYKPKCEWTDVLFQICIQY